MTQVEWITLKQAAELTGASDKTIRRRKEAKRYRSKYVKGVNGKELRVAKEDVLKDVHTLKNPGQQQITQEISTAKADTPGQPDEQPKTPSKEETSMVAAIAEPPKALRVLIADDSEDLAAFLSSQLQKWKVEIAGVAKDGAGALELAEAEKPDLVIAEMDLPGLNGFQLMKEKAKRKGISQIPLVFLSYLKEHAIVQEARQLPGVSAYFCKPLIGPELARLKTWIGEMKKRKEGESRE